MLAILSLAWGFVSKAFDAIFTFCSKPPGIYIAATLAVILAFWWYGHHEHARGVAETKTQYQLASAEAKKKSDAANAELARAVTDLNYRIKIDFAANESRVTFLTQTITREVPIHVTPEIDRAYPLPCGLVRMHDAAILDASAADIGAPGCERDDKPAPAPASAFSKNDVDYIGYCHRVEVQRDALKAALIGVYSAWDSYAASLAKAK